MTVGQLIARLSEFPADMEVRALWDTVPDFPVHRLERFTDKYGTVALLDCGDAVDGDWSIVAEDIRAGRYPPQA